MSHSFKSIALVGNALDLRVAECMLNLTGHLHARGLAPLIDPGVGLAFAPGSVVPCPEQAFATRADLIVAIGGGRHPALRGTPRGRRYGGRCSESTAGGWGSSRM